METQAEEQPASSNSEEAREHSGEQDSKRARLALQHRHVPMLLQRSLDKLKERTVPVNGGRCAAYCNWWREQSRSSSQDSVHLFPVQLIGDDLNPEQLTRLSYSDFAFCSKWGEVLLKDHDWQESTLRAISPVFTEPNIVFHSVEGVLGGEIKLCAANIEAILVFANATRFECLEEACATYLCEASGKMEPEGLSCLMRLGDRLNLYKLLDSIAWKLARRCWLPYMDNLTLAVRYLHKTKRDMKALLHHPRRGAYTELQVLGLLEAASIPEDVIVDVLDLELMGLAELNVLLGILAKCGHSTHNVLLRKAVTQQQLLFQGLTSEHHLLDWQQTSIAENIMLPDSGKPNIQVLLPGSELKLVLQWHREGNGSHSVGVYVAQRGRSTGRNSSGSSNFTMFALRTNTPRLLLPYHYCHGGFFSTPNHSKLGAAKGWARYMNDLSQYYPADFQGPFIIGVRWSRPLTIDEPEWSEDSDSD